MQKIIASFLLIVLLTSSMPISYAAEPEPEKKIEGITAGLNKNNTQGTDGKFSRDLFTGSAGYIYALQFPKGTRGMNPSLSLNYSSYTRDMASIVGYGWDLGISRIYRNSRHGVDTLYTSNEFVADGQDLVTQTPLNPPLSGGQAYLSKKANNLSKYTFSGGKWTVQDTQGNTIIYGQSVDARLADPAKPEKVFAWYIESLTDPFGNKVNYSYTRDESGNVYLSNIRYAYDGSQALYEIQFRYVDKTRSTTSHRTQWELKSTKLLSEVALMVSGQEVRKYVIGYDSLDTPFSHLTSIQHVSSDEALPVTRFTYGTGKDIHLLTKIDNGYGGEVTLSYTPSTAYKIDGELANAKLPILMMTLSRIDYNDTVTGQQSYEQLSYQGGHYYYDSTDIFGREYAGFYATTIVDDTGKKQVSYFHQSQTSQDGSSLGENADHISKKGRTFREELWDTNGKRVLTKITQWTHLAKGDDRYLIIPTRNVSINYSGDGRHTDTGESSEYDQYGQETRKTLYGLVTANTETGEFIDNSDDRRDIVTTYAINPSKNLYGFPHTTTLIGYSQSIAGKSEKIYDGQSAGSVEKGLVTKEIFWTDNNATISKNASYDNRGLLSSAVDPRGNATSVEYDRYGVSPISVTNPMGWKETIVPNYRAGQPASMANANDVTTHNEFDDFGRILSQSIQIRNESPITIQSHAYDTEHLPISEVTTLYFTDDGDETKDIYTYANGFGQTIQTREEGMNNGEYYVSKILYDTRGNQIFLSYPRVESGKSFSALHPAEAGDRFTYDALGRILTRTNATGQVSYTYDGFQTTVTNQAGVKTFFGYDPWGNLQLLTENSNGSVFMTRYTYSPAGKLIRINDAQGNTRKFTYDWLGRVTSMEDLHDADDAYGTVSLVYDPNSNITDRTVQSGETIHWTYDALNRVIRETYPTANDTSTTDFGYDAGSYGRGLMTSLTKGNYSQNYNYNGLGQKSGETIRYGEEDVYNFGYEYDLTGSPTRIVFPDNTVQLNTYEHGLAKSVSYDGQPIITDIVYNAVKKPIKTIYANGIITNMMYDYVYGYRLSGKQSMRGDVGYQILSYTFDNVGNITETRESGLPELRKTINYTYDALNRLTKAQYVMGGTTTDSIVENYTYDAIGNMLTSPAYSSATFGNTSGANPHAITQSDNTIYSYDPRGNLLQKTSPAGTSQYVFNVKNQMDAYLSNTDITLYAYDATGRRILKLTPDTATQYVNQLLEVEKPVILESGLSLPLATPLGGNSSPDSNSESSDAQELPPPVEEPGIEEQENHPEETSGGSASGDIVDESSTTEVTEITEVTNETETNLINE